jgi:hypothetical protein
MIVVNPMALVITTILIKIPGYVSPSIILSSMHEKDDNSGKMLPNHCFGGKNLEIP